MCDRPTHQDPPGLWWILAILSGGSHLLLLLLLPVATVRLAMPAGGGMPDWLPVTLQETAVPTPPPLATIPVEPTPEESDPAPSAPMAIANNEPIAPPQPNPNPQATPQPRPNPNPQATPQPRPNPNPQAMPQPRPNPNPQATPQPNPQATPQPNPNPQPNPTPQPRPNPQATPQPNPNPPATGEFVAILANPTIPNFTDAYGQTVQRDIPDQLATVRTAQKRLAIAQYLIPLGVSLQDQTILEAVVIIDATGKPEVLAEQTRVLAGPLTPAQAGQLAKRIIETWEFNPTIDGGQPKDFDYTLRLTLQTLS